MKTIVVLGAGFGGLAAARKLGRLFLRKPLLGDEYSIILIDRHAYQLYTPALYKIATTSTGIAKNMELKQGAAFHVSDAIKNLPVKFVESRAEKIDLAEQKIILQGGETLKWEYLIIACGTETDFYDIPGLKEYSLPLKTFADALRARDAVEAAFSSPVSKPIRIVVGGGGSTGVEFSAELACWARRLEKQHKKRGVSKIILLEDKPEILAMLQPNVMRKARTRLEDLGVIIRTDAEIKEVRENIVEIDTGERVPFDILIWAGGTKNAAIISDLAIKRGQKDRPETESTMNCVQIDGRHGARNRIFVIGDAACCIDPKTGNATPGLMRAAIEQGIIAASNVAAEIQNNPMRAFSHRTYPCIITVGGKWAVAKTGPFIISGFPGWIVKCLAELCCFTSLLPGSVALKIWLRRFWTFIRHN